MGFGVWGLGFGVWGLRFRVSGFGFRVSGFGCRVSGVGCRVSGFGFRVCVSGWLAEAFGVCECRGFRVLKGSFQRFSGEEFGLATLNRLNPLSPDISLITIYRSTLMRRQVQMSTQMSTRVFDIS